MSNQQTSPMNPATTLQNSSLNQKIGIAAFTMWTLGAIFYAYEYYLRVAPSVMTSELSRAYGVDAASLGHLSASYYYAYVIMQLPVGILMDKFGPRKILTMACFACALGTFLFAATPNIWIAAFGRFIVGFGSAFAYVGVLKLTSMWFPPRSFAMLAGLTTTLGMLGAISGDITMTMLVQALGWEQTVYYSAIMGVALTPILWFVLRDRQIKPPHAHNHQQLNNGDEAGMKLLWRMCRNSQMWINGLYGCLTFMIIAAFAELWSIPFLRDVHGLSPHNAALANSLIFLGFAFGGPIIGNLSDKMGKRRAPMIGGALVAAVIMAAIIYMPHFSFITVCVLLFALGFFAAAECIVFAVGRDNNPQQFAGTAVAFTNMAVMMGGVVLQPLIGYLLDQTSDDVIVDGVRVYTVSDYHYALLVLPAGLVLAALMAYILRETNCKIVGT